MPHESLVHVEDDDASALLLRLAPDEIGFDGSVYRVTNGEDALLFLRKSGPYQNAHTPRLVVLDLNLPKRDGWSVLAERLTDHALKQISFVVMSSAPAWKYERQAVASGAIGYIEKAH